jgi:hypothetical protein
MKWKLLILTSIMAGAAVAARASWDGRTGQPDGPGMPSLGEMKSASSAVPVPDAKPEPASGGDVLALFDGTFAVQSCTAVCRKGDSCESPSFLSIDGKPTFQIGVNGPQAEVSVTHKDADLSMRAASRLPSNLEIDWVSINEPAQVYKQNGEQQQGWLRQTKGGTSLEEKYSIKVNRTQSAYYPAKDKQNTTTQLEVSADGSQLTYRVKETGSSSPNLDCEGGNYNIRCVCHDPADCGTKKWDDLQECALKRVAAAK